MPATAGISATASRPAARAIALLTPEAMPTWRSSAASSTVAVSGATVPASPSPNSATAGRTSTKYDAPAPMRPSRSIPAAASRSPTVIGQRGPIRCARRPDRAESSSMITVIGSIAVPAASGLNPATTCNWRTTSTKFTPSAP